MEVATVRFDRREVLIGGLLSVTSMAAMPKCCAAGTFEVDYSAGCVSFSRAVDGFVADGTDVRFELTGAEPIISKSGNPMFDRALAITLAKLAHAFDVLPGFGYFQEPPDEVPNAMAMPFARLGNPDGTVLFGKRLLKVLMEMPEHPEIGVTAVCAHEWGHILQYKRGLKERLLADSPTVKPLELHADFLAGYFAGLRRREKPDYPAAVIALTQYNSGDPFSYNVRHHGNKQERGAAVVKGFEAAYHDNKPLDEAIETGIGFVRAGL